MLDRMAEQRRRLAIATLAFGACVVVTTEFIVVGLLPSLARELDVSLAAAGRLVSAFALSAALVGPLATLAGSAWRPRDALAGGLLLFGVAGLVSALLPDYRIMLAARVIQGAVLTLYISVANATAAASAPAGLSGRAVGHVNAGTVVAIAAVVPAGLALSELLHWRAVVGGLGAVSILVGGAIRATVPIAASSPRPARQGAVLRQPRFLAHLVWSCLLFAAMFASYSYIAAFLEEAWQLSGSAIALALFGFGLTGLAGNWVASSLVDRDPIRLTLAVTTVLILATGATLLIPQPRTTGWVALAVWGAAHTAAFIACQVRVMFAAPGAEALAGALNIAVCNVGIAAGTLLGGWTISHLGVPAIGAGTVAIGTVGLLVGFMAERHARVPTVATAPRESRPPPARQADRRGGAA